MTDNVPAAENIEETLDRIIQDLASEDGDLPVEAIREAQRRREQITPRLIRVIENATRRTAEEGDPDDNAHFFAFFLLAEFRAAEALPAIVAAVSLPGDLPFTMFGDSITEDLDRIFAILTGDDFGWLDELIANDKLNDYVRWAAAQSFGHLVRDGRMMREDAVERLHRQLRIAMDEEDQEVIVDGLICELMSYSPHEAIDTIREAFERAIPDPTMASLEDVEDSLEEGWESAKRLLDNLDPTAIEDTVEELSWWNSFDEDVEEDAQWEDFDDDVDYDDEFEDDDDEEDYEDEYETAGAPAAVPSVRNSSPRVGRNSPCPCGSGKKFKRCCWGKYEPDEF